MRRDPGDGEKSRRPTAVDDVMWRFAQSRAKDLGLDFMELVEGLSSRSTAWRSASSGVSPQLMNKIAAKLDELEAPRGGISRGDLLRQWNEIGAELLMFEDGGATFRAALTSARDVLAAVRKLDDALAAFRHRAEPDKP